MSRDSMTTIFAVLAAAVVGLAACAHQPRKTAAAAKPKAAEAAPAVAAAAPAPAAAQAVAAAPVVAPKGDKRHVHGRVTAVDASEGTLAIRDSAGRAHHYRVATAAKLTKGGDDAAISLSDLKVGDHVTVWHVQDVAVSIHLRASAGGQVAKNQ